MERRGEPANAEHATSDDYSCTDIYVYWKEHDEVGKVKSSARIRCRWQNILTKLPEVMGQSRKATKPFERWNCLIADEISDNTVQRTNLCILIIHPNFSSESHAKRTGRIEMKGFIGLLCLAGAIRNNSQSLEGLRGADGDIIDLFRLMMSQRRFKFQSDKFSNKLKSYPQNYLFLLTEEQTEVRKCVLLFGAESFVF